jgi:peptide/nickel transport system ATP-binding protein/oligopeptide transport system ATP-binding protein
MTDRAAQPPLLEARGVSKHFVLADSLLWRLRGQSPVTLKAVDGVSLSIYRGETVGLVGESGCGKSTLARLILRLIPASEGSVRFGEIDVLAASGGALRQLRREAQIVFQDPFGSLDPRMKVRSIVAEGMAHLGLDRRRRRERVSELLELVQLTPDAANRFPHEFSGGQRQRISIARALAVDPRLIIADEPVSALDVSVQSQILNLLHDLQERLSLTYLFISHDMSVVRHVADRVAVMYLGRIVETGTAEQVFDNPLHPYTQALLSSVPTLSRTPGRERTMLTGDVPNAIDPPPACRFAGRCPRVLDRCQAELPLLEPAETGQHQLACFNYAPLPEVTNADRADRVPRR